LHRAKEQLVEQRRQQSRDKKFKRWLKARVRINKDRSRAEVGKSKQDRIARTTEAVEKRWSAQADADALKTYSRAVVVAEEIRSSTELQDHREARKVFEDVLGEARAHEEKLQDKRLKRAAKASDQREALRRSELANSLEIERTKSATRRYEVDGEVQARIGEAEADRGKAEAESKSARTQIRANASIERAEQRTERSVRRMLHDILCHLSRRREERNEYRDSRRAEKKADRQAKEAKQEAVHSSKQAEKPKNRLDDRGSLLLGFIPRRKKSMASCGSWRSIQLTRRRRSRVTTSST